MRTGMSSLYDLYYGNPSLELVERDAELRYQANAVLAGFPVVGSFLRYRDDYAYMRDYMANTGLSWTDIKYPTRTTAGVNSALFSGINYVSSNIEKLYK